LSQHRDLGLVPAPAQNARKYKRAAIALATATAFNLTFFLWYFTRVDAVLYVWLVGVLLVVLMFRAVATHARVKSGGATLGTIAVFTNLFAVATVIFWFDEGAVLLTAFATAVSFLIGSAGTLLLFFKASRTATRQ
jgi:uncharacterized membrane protein